MKSKGPAKKARTTLPPSSIRTLYAYRRLRVRPEQVPWRIA